MGNDKKNSLTPIQYFRGVALGQMPSISPWPGLPKTGYPLFSKAGDDADIHEGLPLIGARFTNLEDGTIFDNVTGRMWVANPGLLPPPLAIGGVAQDLNWDDAIDACNNLDYAGHTDWKLPNIKEIDSLFFIMLTGQQIDYNFFSVQNWYHWSSTTYNGLTTAAWCTEWIFGLTYAVQKASNLQVIPVRGMPRYR